MSATKLKEIESFKKNPVLIALAEGRLPDERPNYEYFAQILALNDQITIRPKRCWIFVIHPNVTVRGDGSGYLSTTGDRLDRSEYPHLERNLEREKWPKEELNIIKDSLLHEYTKELRQVESSTVTEVSSGWETLFPELHERLEVIMAADSRCDYLHMNVALDLKEKQRFPTHSNLSTWIEMNIEQHHLLSHRWKVETKLVRPTELSFVNERSPSQTYYETEDEIAIQYQHHSGCDGSRNGSGPGHHQCGCIAANKRKDCIKVPFPVDEWARILTNCAQYPAHPFQGGRRGASRRMAAATLKREDSNSEDSDDTESSSNRSSVGGGDGGQPTQMELVPQIAMLQEIWSCPPESLLERDGAGSASRQPQWTRRAVILWTFETIHSLDSDGKLLPSQSGKTSWRFLTVLDPKSPYHQQKAVLSSSDAAAAGQVIGPNRHTVAAATAAAAAGRSSLSINPHYPGTSHGMGGSTDAFIPSPISSSMGGRAADHLIMSPASSYPHRFQNAAAATGMSDVYPSAPTSTAWGGGGGTDTRSSFSSSVGSGATHLGSAAAASGYDAQFQMMLEHSMTRGGHGAGQRLGSHSGASVQSGLETPPPSATMSNSFNHNFDAAGGAGAGAGAGNQHYSHQYPAHHTALTTHTSHHHHPHPAHNLPPPQPSLSDLSAVTDPFLTGASNIYGALPPTTAPSTWSAATGLDSTWSAAPAASTGYAGSGVGGTQQWGARTSSSSSAQHLHPQSAASHHGSNPVSRAGSIDGRYNHHLQQASHQHQQHQQQWQGSGAAGSVGLVDDQDLWTPATSTGPDVHWPVAVDEQEHHHQSQSQPQQMHNNHYQHRDQYQSQPSQHQHQQQHQHRSTISNSPEGGHRLSQEWDEVVTSQGAALVEEVHMGDGYHHSHHPQSHMRGVKRTRSVAGLGEGDEEEEEDGDDGDDNNNNDGDYEED